MFLLLLAEVKARSVPRLLRRATVGSFVRRWSTIVAVAGQAALAANLRGERPDTHVQATEWNVPLGTLLCEDRHAQTG